MWWQGAVVYQIYPLSFYDRDGDGQGDLAGVAEKLAYVADLGVDAIWLSPVFKSPMRDYGYDVEDYTAIDPRFGVMADFERLIEAAHALGLRVIIDQVLAHTSDRHDWFAKSRAGDPLFADWYVWADPRPDGAPPNNWLSLFGGPGWSWDAGRRQYYLHSFLPEQPHLNLHNPAVRAALLEVLRFWLDLGADGFRLDAANFYLHDPSLADNPPRAQAEAPDNPYFLQHHVHDRSRPDVAGFLAEIRGLLDRYADRVAMAEVFDEEADARRAAEYSAPGLLHTAYSFAILQPSLSAGLLREAIGAFFEASPESWPTWAFSNHDVVRAATRWAGEGIEPRPAKLLIALLLALPGTICLYQGEELGLPQAELAAESLRDPSGRHRGAGRDGARTPMPWRAGAPHAGFTSGAPWLPVPEAHLPLAVDRQEADPQSVLGFTRTMLRWRRQAGLARAATFELPDAPEPVFAIVRDVGGDRHLLAFNLSAAPVRVPLSDLEVSEVLHAEALARHGLAARAKGDGIDFAGHGMLWARV